MSSVLAVAVRRRCVARPHRYRWVRAATTATAPEHRPPPPPPSPDLNNDEDEDEPKMDPRALRQIVVLTGSQFVANLGFGCVIPVLPLFATEIGMGASGVGFIIAAPSIARLACNMPFGRAVDQYGRKVMMVGGQATMAAASIATAGVTSPWTMLPARLMLGVGSAASMAGTSAYMADVTEEVLPLRARIMGVQQQVINAAYAAGPAVGGVLAEAYGVRTSFLIVGGAAGLCSLGFSTLPETLKEPKVIEHEASKALVEQKETWTAVYGPLLKSHQQQGLLVLNFALFTSYSALLVALPLHAAAVFDASPGDIGYLFSIGGLIGLLGAPVGGYLADRLGRKSTVGPSALLISVGAASLTLPHVTTFASMVPAIAVWGLGNSLLGPPLTAFSADVAPADKRGTALALSRQAQDAAFLVAPISLGILAELTSTSVALQFTSATVFAAAAFFGWRTTETHTWKPRKKRPSAPTSKEVVIKKHQEG